MTVLLQAPFPNIETTTGLPNPEFSDVENQKGNVSIRRSKNNFVRTYIKKRTRHAFNYTFVISRAKAIELERFIDTYNEIKILVTNHKDERWLVNLTNNPFEFNLAGRAADFPGKEYVTIPLTFEGILI